jgi:hypothetical protein
MKKIIFILLIFLSILGLAQSNLQLPYPVKNVNAGPVDAFYYNQSNTVYNSVSEALTQVSSTQRYIGQLLNIKNIWYTFETGIADANLIPKQPIKATISGTDTYTSTVTGLTSYNGVLLLAQFTNANLTTSPTLNITSIGATAIKINNASVTAGAISAGATYWVSYDGTYWQLLGAGGTGTINSGTANYLPFYSATGTTLSQIPTVSFDPSKGLYSATRVVNTGAGTFAYGGYFEVPTGTASSRYALGISGDVSLEGTTSNRIIVPSTSASVSNTLQFDGNGPVNRITFQGTNGPLNKLTFTGSSTPVNQILLTSTDNSAFNQVTFSGVVNQVNFGGSSPSNQFLMSGTGANNSFALTGTFNTFSIGNNNAGSDVNNFTVGNNTSQSTVVNILSNAYTTVNINSLSGAYSIIKNSNSGFSIQGASPANLTYTLPVFNLGTAGAGGYFSGTVVTNLPGASSYYSGIILAAGSYSAASALSQSGATIAGTLFYTPQIGNNITIGNVYGLYGKGSTITSGSGVITRAYTAFFESPVGATSNYALGAGIIASSTLPAFNIAGDGTITSTGQATFSGIPNGLGTSSPDVQFTSGSRNSSAGANARFYVQAGAVTGYNPINSINVDSNVSFLGQGVQFSTLPTITPAFMYVKGNTFSAVSLAQTISNASSIYLDPPTASTNLTITNPYTLYSNGKLYTTGFQLGTSTTAGYVLTADANGNGTWAASSGGGGSGTVNSGTANQLAYYASTGTALSGSANLTWDGTSLLNGISGIKTSFYGAFGTAGSTQIGTFLSGAGFTILFVDNSGTSSYANWASFGSILRDGTGPTALNANYSYASTSSIIEFQSSTKAVQMPNVTNIASVTTPVNGHIAYDAATNLFNFRQNGAWVNLGGGVTTFSAGTTGLTPSTATSGAVTLGGTLAVANGGTGTSTPALVAGTNVTISGTWPNQTINASLGGGAVTSSGTTGNLAKFTTSSNIGNATAGTDYLTPTGSGSGLSGIVTSITGTTNQITASASTGAVTLSLPSTIITSGTIQSTSAGAGQTSGFYVNSSIPAIAINLSTGGTDAKAWDIVGLTNNLQFRARNDANSIGDTYLSIVRSGSSVTSVQFPVGTFTISSLSTAGIVTNTAAGQLGTSNGTGFLKMTSGTISYDNSTYLTSAGAVTTFSGGTTGLTPSSATSGAITLGGTLAVANGGTGNANGTANIAGGTVGAIPYQTAANTTGIVAATATANQPLLSGSSAIPFWATYQFAGTAAQTYTFPTTSKTLAANDGSNWTFPSQAIGDLHYATSTTAYGRLADVATGSVLISGGVGVAPSWSTTPTFTGTNISGTAASLTAGNATKLATARTIAGTSFDGSANVTLANKFIVQGTADTGLTAAQFLGALGTGIVKNTTTTGVLSIAVAGTDYVPSYPGAGIANSTGSAWGTSYTTTGSGTVVALQTSPSITTSLVTGSTSFDLLNTTVTSINFGGAGSVNMNNTSLAGNLTFSANVPQINLGTSSSGGLSIGKTGSQTGSVYVVNISDSGMSGTPTQTAGLIVQASSIGTTRYATNFQGNNLFQGTTDKALPILQLTPFTQTTGIPNTILRLNNASHTGITASIEVTEFIVDFSRTLTWATGALTTQRHAIISSGTLAFGGASTVTDAVGLEVNNPNGGTNATVTNSSAIRVPTRALTGVTNGYGLNITAPTGATNNYAANLGGKIQVSGDIQLNGSVTQTIGTIGGAYTLNLATNSTTRLSIDGTGQATLSVGVVSGGTPTALTIATQAHTGSPSVTYGLNVTAATGGTLKNWSASFNGGSGVFAGAGLTTPKLIGSTVTAPAISLGNGAGTAGSPSASVDSNATDLAGQVTVNTGTSLSAGAPIITLTFYGTYANAPKILLTPANSTAANITASSQVYVTSTTTTLVINASAPLNASSTYIWNYFVVQ